MPIIDFINSQKVVILDGGFGTELQARGFQTKLPLWSAPANLDDPDLVRQIHVDYIQAGSDIITTNTFRTNVRAYRLIDKPELSIESSKRAVELAHEARKVAGNDNVFVAGALAPVEDCYDVESVPPEEELIEEHFVQARLLKEMGVDCILIETMNTLLEAKVSLQAAKETGLPVFVSFVVNENGDLLSGETLQEVITELDKIGSNGYMLNCRTLTPITVAAEKMAPVYSGIKGIYANGKGEPADDLGWEFHDNSNPDMYLDYAKKWYDLGFKIIGGCCGTDVEYIKVLASYFSKL